MIKARIYQPDKTAMQSGKSKDGWLFEFVPNKPEFIDPLMGWTGMTDMPQEIRITFPSKDAAIAHAEREGISYEVISPQPRHQVRKTYADNFRFNKVSG